MMSYEQDPDVVRWGLQLFDGDPTYKGSYGDSIIRSETSYFHGEHVNDGVQVIESIHTSEDGITKYNLQGQLPHLELLDMSDSHIKNVETQSQNYSRDWIGHFENYNPGFACDVMTEEIRPSTSCCPCREPSSDVWICTLDVIDEHSLDCEVGKRLNRMIPIPVSEYSLDCEVGKKLNQMNPIPHVPKVNGEVPSVDEATLDHQRLLDRLQMYQLIELKVQGDGNCQFRALSDQFYRTIEHHEFVRQQVVDQLKSHRDIYEGYVPLDYDDYLEKMSKNGEWGDNVTLQAAADSYGVKVVVVTSFKDTCYIEIIPIVQKSNRVICLSFWAEVHYNSIYPEGDILPPEVKKKKRRSYLNEHGNDKALTAEQQPNIAPYISSKTQRNLSQLHQFNPLPINGVKNINYPNWRHLSL